MLVFIVSEQPVPYLNPHGVAVEGFRLVGDIDTQAAKRPVEGAGERVVGMVELVIAADNKMLSDIIVDACPKVSCNVPRAANVIHSCEFESIPSKITIEVFP